VCEEFLCEEIWWDIGLEDRGSKCARTLLWTLYYGARAASGLCQFTALHISGFKRSSFSSIVIIYFLWKANFLISVVFYSQLKVTDEM